MGHFMACLRGPWPGKGHRDVCLGMGLQFISDMCMRLGEAMTVFLKRDVETIEDLDLYAFTNNGPVAICLTKVRNPVRLGMQGICGEVACAGPR
jgi:hypothetical protein